MYDHLFLDEYFISDEYIVRNLVKEKGIEGTPWIVTIISGPSVLELPSTNTVILYIVVSWLHDK